MAKSKEQTTSFLDDVAGQGLETLDNNAIAQAYLSMIQQGSQFIDENNKPGTWRNSATGENYGDSVNVIPLAVKTIWAERSSEAPFGTVGRYEPGSIEVKTEKAKTGYPRMTNPETGNKIEELFIYALLNADNPELGVLLFSPTVSSMKGCKAWNSQLRIQRLPSGKPAPLYYNKWQLNLGITPNKTRPSENIVFLAKTIKLGPINEDMYKNSITPQLEFIKPDQLLLSSNPDEE